MELAKRIHERQMEEKMISDNNVSESEKWSVNEVTSFEKCAKDSQIKNLMHPVRDML